MSTTTLAERPQRISALGVMASRFNVEPDKLLSTLKSTCFKGASNDEMLALVVVANEYGLNPLTKEIYAFPAKGGGIVPVVSVDGWIRIINDHPQMDGIEFEWEKDAKTNEPISCTAIIHRKDRSHPTKVTEYLSECRRNTDPWKMTHRMLRHKALIQGGRVAFGFGGIYDEDEALDIASRVKNAKPVFATAVSDPINPFIPIQDEPEDNVPMDNEVASAAAAPATQDEEPKFTPDTPQKKLALAVNDFGCMEHTFISTFKKLNKKMVNGAETIAGLSDEAAEAALNEIDSLLAATEN